MIGKTVVVRGGGGWRRTLGLGQRCVEAKKKIDGSDYQVREWCAAET
jgi:hypothetical protein